MSNSELVDRIVKKLNKKGIEINKEKIEIYLKWHINAGIPADFLEILVIEYFIKIDRLEKLDKLNQENVKKEPIKDNSEWLQYLEDEWDNGYYGWLERLDWSEFEKYEYEREWGYPDHYREKKDYDPEWRDDWDGPKY